MKRLSAWMPGMGTKSWKDFGMSWVMLGTGTDRERNEFQLQIWEWGTELFPVLGHGNGPERHSKNFGVDPITALILHNTFVLWQYTTSQTYLLWDYILIFWLSIQNFTIKICFFNQTFYHRLICGLLRSVNVIFRIKEPKKLTAVKIYQESTFCVVLICTHFWRIW